MPSTRTQIYLTEEQRRRLDSRGRRTGASLAHMIREAVDTYIGDESVDVEGALEETFGRTPDFEVPDRSEWNRVADPG